MITVYKEIMAYCHGNNKGIPSKDDLFVIGRRVKAQFHKVWCPTAEVDNNGLIKDAGFVKQEENGVVFTVTAYPDGFQLYVQGVIDGYYKAKKEKVIINKVEVGYVKKDGDIGSVENPVKKERKRMPIKNEPVKTYSSKK